MKILRITSLLATLAMAFTFNTALADDECENQGIFGIADGVGGTANLCINANGLKAQFNVKGLMAGDAYTIWWVYFDDPSLCLHGPEDGACGEGDLGPYEDSDEKPLGDGTPLGVFGRFGSAVAPRNGKTHITGTWGGMQPSSDAEIWLLMLGHGPANDGDGRHLARQLLTPEDPAAGMPHLGNAVDGVGFTPVAITVYIVD
jgi:hypothetical protein